MSETPQQEAALDTLASAIDNAIDAFGGADGGFVTGWAVYVVSTKPDPDDTIWGTEDQAMQFIKPGTSVTLMRGLLEQALDRFRDRS